jgi:hypothetical protein
MDQRFYRGGPPTAMPGPTVIGFPGKRLGVEVLGQDQEQTGPRLFGGNKTAANRLPGTEVGEHGDQQGLLVDGAGQRPLGWRPWSAARARPAISAQASTRRLAVSIARGRRAERSDRSVSCRSTGRG